MAVGVKVAEVEVEVEVEVDVDVDVDEGLTVPEEWMLSVLTLALWRRLPLPLLLPLLLLLLLLLDLELVKELMRFPASLLDIVPSPALTELLLAHISRTRERRLKQIETK